MTLYMEAARGLAVRVVTEFDGDLESRLREVFQLCLTRDPEQTELDSLTSSWLLHRDVLQRTPESVARLFGFDLPGVPRVDGAAWVTLGSALLNLDEFLTRE